MPPKTIGMLKRVRRRHSSADAGLLKVHPKLQAGMTNVDNGLGELVEALNLMRHWMSKTKLKTEDEDHEAVEELARLVRRCARVSIRVHQIFMRGGEIE